MDKQIFKKWEPMSCLPNEMYLEGLHDDYEGFRLLLKGSGDKGKILRIAFDPSLVYRNIDEGDFLKMANDGEGLMKWCLFTVENSTYEKWFHEQSYNIRESENIVHYAIYTPNDCIDVLSAYPPKVEWLN